jgi:hypothetical protein
MDRRVGLVQGEKAMKCSSDGVAVCKTDFALTPPLHHSLTPSLEHTIPLLPFRDLPIIPPMAFHLVQIIYWLALSTWFGGVLFVAVSAPVIFKTIRESNPLLPTVLSVNLEGQHGTLLAGSIVADLLAVLIRVQLACAAALLIAIGAQWAMMADDDSQRLTNLLRSALYLAAVGLVIYDWKSLSPRIVKAREEYIENADDPEIANPAKDRFDGLHRESVMILMILAGLLLGMVLFSAGIKSTARVITFG